MPPVYPQQQSKVKHCLTAASTQQCAAGQQSRLAAKLSEIAGDRISAGLIASQNPDQASAARRAADVNFTHVQAARAGARLAPDAALGPARGAVRPLPGQLSGGPSEPCGGSARYRRQPPHVPAGAAPSTKAQRQASSSAQRPAVRPPPVQAQLHSRRAAQGGRRAAQAWWAQSTSAEGAW